MYIYNAYMTGAIPTVYVCIYIYITSQFHSYYPPTKWLWVTRIQLIGMSLCPIDHGLSNYVMSNHFPCKGVNSRW